MVSPLSFSPINSLASIFIQCSRNLLSQSQPSDSIDKQLRINHNFNVSRRGLSFGMGMGAIALLSQLQAPPPARADEEAEDPPTFNGWWLTGPIPSPTVTAKIMNEETGTRSFLQTGIYLGQTIGPEVSAYKLKQQAFDLLAMKDLIYQGDVWPHIRRYLCLKSTMMYYNFDILISGSPDDQKAPLTDLANRLFDSAEILLEAVKKQDEALTKSKYADTEIILQEVLRRMGGSFDVEQQKPTKFSKVKTLYAENY